MGTGELKTEKIGKNTGKDTSKDTNKDIAQIMELMELLFFAYRDFISDPDEILEKYGFGRAHHRIIHFVGRHPGIRVAELLSILRITKQSLGRVLKELIDTGYVYQQEGETDRRRRLLYLTDSGCELHKELMSPQIERIKSAINSAEVGLEGAHREMLFKLIDANDRDHVSRLFSQAMARCDGKPEN